MSETHASFLKKKKSIVLIGLMGSGKTTVGKKLSYRLNIPFIDSDDEVAKAYGYTIPEIFKIYGEEAFRRSECETIIRLLNEKLAIIATGGGAFLNIETRKEIGRLGISIWLRATLDILAERTANQTGRPLLNDGKPKQKLQFLIAQRYPIYAKADIVIDTGSESALETMNLVYNALNMK
tara:strand:- start:329 stop:868 length:540 start_codon:yes stop_codon:yes gene_type:complete